jgi:hypothetical protein
MEFQIEQAKENRKRKVKFGIADFRSHLPAPPSVGTGAGRQGLKNLKSGILNLRSLDGWVDPF